MLFFGLLFSILYFILFDLRKKKKKKKKEGQHKITAVEFKLYGYAVV